MDKEGYDNAKRAMEQVSLDSDDEAKLAKSAQVVAKSGVPKKHHAGIAQAHKNMALKGKARNAADKTKLDAGNAFGKGAHAAAKTAAKPRKQKKVSKD
jgi:ribosomal protein L11 methylase PrmA